MVGGRVRGGVGMEGGYGVWGIMVVSAICARALGHVVSCRSHRHQRHAHSWRCDLRATWGNRQAIALRTRPARMAIGSNLTTPGARIYASYIRQAQRAGGPSRAGSYSKLFYCARMDMCVYDKHLAYAAKHRAGKPHCPRMANGGWRGHQQPPHSSTRPTSAGGRARQKA